MFHILCVTALCQATSGGILSGWQQYPEAQYSKAVMAVNVVVSQDSLLTMTDNFKMSFSKVLVNMWMIASFHIPNIHQQETLCCWRIFAVFKAIILHVNRRKTGLQAVIGPGAFGNKAKLPKLSINSVLFRS